MKFVSISHTCNIHNVKLSCGQPKKPCHISLVTAYHNTESAHSVMVAPGPSGIITNATMQADNCKRPEVCLQSGAFYNPTTPQLRRPYVNKATM